MTNESNKMSAEELIQHIIEWNAKGKPLGLSNPKEAIDIFTSQQTQSIQKQIEELKAESFSRYCEADKYKRINDEHYKALIAQTKEVVNLQSQLSQKDEMLERMAEAMSKCFIKDKNFNKCLHDKANKILLDALNQYKNSKK